MKKISASIIFFIILDLSAQESLTNSLQKLTISLNAIQNELEKPPVPPREYETEYIPGFDLPLPKRGPEKRFTPPLRRTQSARMPHVPIEETSELEQKLKKRRSVMWEKK